MATQLSLWAAVTITAWFLTGVYFIVSMFLTRKIASKEAGATRMGDRALIWGGYVLIFLDPLGQRLWHATFLAPRWREPAGVAGAVLAVAGLGYTCWARASLGQYWSGIVALKQDHKLVQSGPYRSVRHPLYTGLLAATAGAALAFGFWRSLLGAALLWAAFLSRARREDALLGSQFGAEFDAYRAHTGRLLPRALSR
ncbi:MAG: methyltransferase family protein [Terriglobales bacterium]